MNPNPDSIVISVVMAVFNGAATVARAVESIQRQTFREWELVIIDDASTDATASIIAELAAKEPRIRVLRNETNRRLAASLNIGWRAARASLIARMDADDVSLPGRLESQVEFMAGRPDVDVLGTGVELVDRSGEVLGIARRPQAHDDLARRIHREVPFYHPTVIARRDYFERFGGYDERWKRCEDSELWMRSVHAARFHNLQEVLLRYTVGGNVSFAEAIERSKMVLHRAVEEKRLITHGWYAGRVLVSQLMSAAGLRNSRR